MDVSPSEHSDLATDAPPSEHTDLATREARLVAALSRARRSGRVSLTERALLVAGGALAVSGVVLIVVGWVGTSRTILVAGQIPYVVSGGLLGLALVFLGGFVYFAYWLALLVRDGRRRDADNRDDIRRLGTALDESNRSLALLVATIADRPVRRASAASTARARSVTARVEGAPLATPTGSVAHRADCRLVSGRDDLRPAPPGAVACRVCGGV